MIAVHGRTGHLESELLPGRNALLVHGRTGHLEIESTLKIELEHKEADYQDAQSSHSETQKTIRNGDNAEGVLKYIRPSHATVSLIAAVYYGIFTDSPDIMVLGAFLTLPFTYAGLREIGKRNVLAFNKKS